MQTNLSKQAALPCLTFTIFHAKKSNHFVCIDSKFFLLFPSFSFYVPGIRSLQNMQIGRSQYSPCKTKGWDMYKEWGLNNNSNQSLSCIRVTLCYEVININCNLNFCAMTWKVACFPLIIVQLCSWTTT